MLSTIKHALGQTCRLSSRLLSTATATSQPLLDPAAIPLLNVSMSVSHDEALDQKIFNRFQPLYLSMSSLIRPEPDAPPSDSLVELDPSVFAHPIRRDILHLCVVHYLDCQRQGTASTKTRGEVRGSGHKIRPQKGSGRARLGDKKSPMLRGGGVAFGPKPRDFATKLNQKVVEMGMRVALSARVKEQSLGIVESLEWPGTKTKDLQERIEELGWRKTLFVTGLDSVPQGLSWASGNISSLATTTAEDMNVYTALKWPRIVLDLAAVEWFERKLGKSNVPPRSYNV
ncbi:50S ribosomal protein L4 [Grifola frondosa]|uniref:Large ribosomal subunit protein uL4m n=1 Tax=Grifola frondosa TaxID=5627 RepID=A0A1C7MR26_GRIFR|nr:50S ribosomal protein L4 [Grifola frondosa]